MDGTAPFGPAILPTGGIEGRYCDVARGRAGARPWVRVASFLGCVCALLLAMGCGGDGGSVARLGSYVGGYWGGAAKVLSEHPFTHYKNDGGVHGVVLQSSSEVERVSWHNYVYKLHGQPGQVIVHHRFCGYKWRLTTNWVCDVVVDKDKEKNGHTVVQVRVPWRYGLWDQSGTRFDDDGFCYCVKISIPFVTDKRGSRLWIGLDTKDVGNSLIAKKVHVAGAYGLDGEDWPVKDHARQVWEPHGNIKALEGNLRVFDCACKVELAETEFENARRRLRYGETLEDATKRLQYGETLRRKYESLEAERLQHFQATYAKEMTKAGPL